MKIGYSEGPWEIDEDRPTEILAAGGTKIAACYITEDFFPDDQSINNAALIAAAPELLEALLYYKEQCSGTEPSLSVFNSMVDKALAKAIGDN